MVHLSIQKGFSIPSLQKCNDCCSEGQYHCPLCRPAFFKPTNRSTVMAHLISHRESAINFGEYTIHRCGLQCRSQPHYHCLHCGSTMIKKKDFTAHLLTCSGSHQSRAFRVFNSQTAATPLIQSGGLNAPSLAPGKSDVLSCDLQSGVDSYVDNMTIIHDSDDEEMGSHSVTVMTYKSSEFDAVHKFESSVKPVPMKCHQTVQTDLDKPQDCDEYYFMSLVKLFKKLSPQKKADVRLKIERLLFEAEFE